MEKDNEIFDYTYSASQQKEIENIRRKYIQPEEDKMEQLRKLHNSATRKAQTWALTLGILGALIMGTGMSLAMTQLGALVGGLAMPVGILVGLCGMALVAAAYPVYNAALKKERARIAPQILRLTDELMK